MTLVKQKLSNFTILTQFILFTSGIIQNSGSVIETLHGPDILYILSVSYLYCDFWLWLLHCFLDRKENIHSNLQYIKNLAISFQGHHDNPGDILNTNHLSEIDPLVSGVSLTALLLGKWTSSHMKLIMLSVNIWGALGATNHYYGHAITRRYKYPDIPNLYFYGQKFKLLPTARHHKSHHCAPFEKNWNFLNGLHSLIYEPLYFKFNKPYIPLYTLFYLFNPISIQFIMLFSGVNE